VQLSEQCDFLAAAPEPAAEKSTCKRLFIIAGCDLLRLSWRFERNESPDTR
jgi:hypothetical protein